MEKLSAAQWRALAAIETNEWRPHFMVSWMALADRGFVQWPTRFIQGRPHLTDAGRAALQSHKEPKP